MPSPFARHASRLKIIQLLVIGYALQCCPRLGASFLHREFYDLQQEEAEEDDADGDATPSVNAPCAFFDFSSILEGTSRPGFRCEDGQQGLSAKS